MWNGALWRAGNLAHAGINAHGNFVNRNRLFPAQELWPRCFHIGMICSPRAAQIYSFTWQIFVTISTAKRPAKSFSLRKAKLLNCYCVFSPQRLGSGPLSSFNCAIWRGKLFSRGWKIKERNVTVWDAFSAESDPDNKTCLIQIAWVMKMLQSYE